MKVHLVDGTYEIFRYFFAVPPHRNRSGQEVAATRGVVGSLLGLLESGATHVGVATDHVIESFRNDLYPDYKTGDGIEPELRSQFPLLEDALRAAGFTVWPMLDHEADDGLASVAQAAGSDPRVEQVLICTPDKDLAQCVRGRGIVQLDRRKEQVYDADGVVAKFGVPPESIPDYLALVGDSADGFPGLPGWGAKSTATVLARYAHLERVPPAARDWDVKVRGADKLASTLAARMEDALLFKRLATLVVDAVQIDDVASLEWVGPRPEFEAICADLDAGELVDRAGRLAGARSS
jgi:5'-3' exonuclease